MAEFASANVWKASQFRTISAAGPSLTLANLGETISVTATITRADGDPWDRNVTALAVDDVGATYDSQSNAPTTGTITFSHTPADGDKAANDTTGTAYHLRVSSADGNVQLDTADAWNVSSFYYVDLHPQLSGTFNATADFEQHDTDEDYDFVILGDKVNIWVIIEGVRNDGTAIDTSGSAVSLVVTDPDLAVWNTYALDTGAAPSNNNTPGVTPKLGVDPTSPAGNWEFACTVSYLGNSGGQTHELVYITPLTSNLRTMLASPVLVFPGDTLDIPFRCEQDNVAQEPQNLPTWTLYRPHVDAAWDEISSGDMVNIVNGTATVNGAHYRIDQLTIPQSETDGSSLLLWAEAQLNGNPIKDTVSIRVSDLSLDPAFGGRYRT